MPSDEARQTRLRTQRKRMNLDTPKVSVPFHIFKELFGFMDSFNIMSVLCPVNRHNIVNKVSAEIAL